MCAPQAREKFRGVTRSPVRRPHGAREVVLVVDVFCETRPLAKVLAFVEAAAAGVGRWPFIPAAEPVATTRRAACRACTGAAGSVRRADSIAAPNKRPL